MIRKLIMSLIFCTLACTQANAAMELAIGHVTLIEASYMPGSINFQMDVATASCPIPSYFKWTSTNTDSNKAVYATLLTAFSTGKPIDFYVNAGDTSCTGIFIHLHN